MIPKTIHYCWFGHGEKPEKIKKCIASWSRFCLDYNIIEWNEENFDVSQNAYTEYMYANRKFAFLSDYIRLYIIYQHGGIYLDTDVELVKPLDDLLELSGFVGFENNHFINTGLGFGAEKNHPVVAEMLREYSYFPKEYDEAVGPKGCPVLNTQALIHLGLQCNGQKQTIDGMTVFPEDYFNPYDSITGKMCKTPRTYSIHWYAGSWLSKREQLRSKITKPIHRLLYKLKRNSEEL